MSCTLPGKNQLLPMYALERMKKCWPVVLTQDIVANLNNVVRSDAKNIGIERAVMDRTHCDAVRDDGLATICILFDMCGIQELAVSKSAQ